MDAITGLRTIHLIPRFGRGGAEEVIRELISGAKDMQPIIGCSGGDGIPGLERQGLSWVRIPLFPFTLLNILRSFFLLRQIVRRHHIGLIHSHHRFSSLVGRAVAQLLNIPFICTVHDLADGHRFITRLALGNNVTVFSQSVAQHLMDQFHFNQENIYHVPMGIAPIVRSSPREIKERRLEMGCFDHTPIIGFAGRLVSEKGPDIFLQSAPQVLLKFHETRFLVIGDGEMREELQSLVLALGISDNVTFLGWRNNAASFIECTDLMVVPSLREGFGRVALESLMYGKPVIATRVGGLPELISHEQNGLLVPPADSSALGEAIIRLLGDEALRNKMAEHALEMIQGHFVLATMVREMRACYQSVLMIHDRRRSVGALGGTIGSRTNLSGD